MYNLPGKKSQELWDKDINYVISGRTNIADSLPLVFEKGKGIYIYDVDGNEYIDFSAGILTASTGHCHPTLVKKLEKQIQELWHVYAFPTPERANFCKTLKSYMPEGIDTFAFYCEGSITVEAALRAASSYNKRWSYAAMTHAYHGRTLQTRSLGSYLLPKEFGPVVNVTRFHYPNCYRCPMKLKHPECDLACIEASTDLLQGSNTELPSAVIFEPIAGAGGIIVPPKGAWKRLAEICREKEMLVIADEVLTGVGRTGKFLAIEHFDVTPDITTFGKGLGSGFPIMVVAGRKEIMGSYPYGSAGGGGSSTSFGGSPLAVAAAEGTLEVFEQEELIKNARERGKEIEARTADWKEKYPAIGDIRGIGLLWAIDIVKDRVTKEVDNDAWNRIYLNCMRNGLRLVPNRLCPPLTITSEELHRSLDILEEGIKTETKK